jgi:C-terminal processing protease CtpA/Prc
MKNLKYFSVGIILVLIFLFMPMGCKKSPSTPQTPVTTDSVSMQINKFIWFGLNYEYLWVDSVPQLSEVYFHSSLDSLNRFLSLYTDHEKLFTSLLYKYQKVDQWSWIVDDYVALENLFQGITKSLGYSYGLVRITSSNDIFGYVQYVIKGSPADNAGVHRGDIFIKVNNQQLTVSNYRTLLTDTIGYSLSFANITNRVVVPNGRTVNMAATVVYENPVYYDTIFNVNNNKVGYLVYNGFISDYDVQLNQVFSTFKGAGVNKLILDLRYNGGGSIQSAVYLASMIYTTAVGKPFISYQFNKNYGADLLNYYGANFSTNYFTDIIEQTTTTPQTPISSLSLTDLYVITTSNTASASELIINGLRPYMNVVTVGDTTDGKNVGSQTIYDYYNYNGTLNPNHTWAMQPIIFKLTNSAGQSNYGGIGFAPTIYAPEDFGNILPFGNPSETMLKTALDYIQGLKSAPVLYKGFRKMANSKDFIPHSKEMYVNKDFLKNLPKKKSKAGWK